MKKVAVDLACAEGVGKEAGGEAFFSTGSPCTMEYGLRTTLGDSRYCRERREEGGEETLVLMNEARMYNKENVQIIMEAL